MSYTALELATHKTPSTYDITTHDGNCCDCLYISLHPDDPEVKKIPSIPRAANSIYK